MSKKQNLVIGCCFFASALLLAVYGADFSWRKAILAGAALMLWSIGEDLWKAAFTGRPFTRYQFRIQISGLGLALKEAGIYGEELSDAAEFIYENTTGQGWITFTWLESELFFINTTNHYSSNLEIGLDLPAYGERETTRNFQLADIIEMRRTGEGYELVLLTREQRSSNHGFTRDMGLVLFKLPYIFFWSLQGDQRERHKKATEILAAVGFKYRADEEVSSAWFYENQYGSFRWWHV